MTLSSEQMRELERQSAEFGEAHKSYLAEAIDAVRTTRSTHAASRLLSLLSKTARRDQSEAIRVVRTWLDERLRDEPGVSSDRLLLELGWLRRMCVVRAAEKKHTSGHRNTGRQ